MSSAGSGMVYWGIALMGLRLTPVEWLLERLNLLPMPLLDTPLAGGIGKALVTACELGVFDALRARPLTVHELAACLDCHPHGVYALLQLLVAAGYLRVSRERYSNRAVTRRWLCADSPVNIAPYIVHSPDIVALWEHLPEVVRTGQAAAHLPYEDDPTQPEVRAALERHYAGLAALAMVLGQEIVHRIRLPAGSTRLLDVGGSHAAYSLLFCRKHPTLHATVVDLPPGIEAGKRTMQHTAEGARVDFLCQDIVREAFPAHFAHSFDVALYFHIAHLLPPEVNQQLLERVACCLKPGGTLIFVDQLTDATHSSRLTTAMVQLMALTVSAIGGTCYPFATVKGWL
ncbi:MAG: class I SAM-dependent methyltransferase, partial [Ktedonobacteraceae bacterium]